MNYQTLDSQTLKKHKQCLMQSVLSGKSPLQANPFLPNIEKIFEEFGIWRQEFYDKIAGVLKRDGSHGLIVARYEEVDGEIHFVRGYRLPVELEFDDYNTLGFELDFIGNGANNLLYDETFDWVIGTVVDVHFIGASSTVMPMFFASLEERRARETAFKEWASTNGLAAPYSIMPSYM